MDEQTLTKLIESQPPIAALGEVKGYDGGTTDFQVGSTNVLFSTMPKV